MARILVFGDSITYGKVDTQGGWTSRLRRYFDEQTADQNYKRNFPDVYNQGISADTAEDILKRLDVETSARIKEEIIFVLAIGTNDSVLDNGQPRYVQEKFQSNYKEILQRMEKYSNKILIVGLLPVNEELTTPVPWRTKRHYTNKQVLLFDEIIKDIAKSKNLPYVSLFNIFENKLDLFPDGLHPDDKGHQLIFEQVKPQVLKIIES
jgi:acyl-CoA thioesterase I